MKREKEFDKSFILLMIMMLVIIITSFYLYFQVRTDKISELVKSESVVPVVFIISENQKPLLTELFLFYPHTGKGALLDIPGNTGSIIQQIKKMDRIDSLYNEENIDPFINKIGQLTDLEIPFYFILSLDNLSKMVDLIDGLQLFIANPIDLKDRDSRILLPSGSVTLDGSKIISYLKYSLDGESDAEKIDRNQKFTRSFLEKMSFQKDYLAKKDLYKYIQTISDTNMDRKSFENFFIFIDDLDMNMLIYQKILGVKRTVGSQELLFPHYDERLLKEMVLQTKENLVSIRSLSEKGISYSVEILNGTDINGMASRTAQVFKSFGYKIAGVANATKPDGKEYEHTVVLDRKDNPESAKELAELIKCKRWSSESLDSLDDTIDITIILGKDFDGRYVK